MAQGFPIGEARIRTAIHPAQAPGQAADPADPNKGGVGAHGLATTTDGINLSNATASDSITYRGYIVVATLGRQVPGEKILHPAPLRRCRPTKIWSPLCRGS